MYRLYVVQLGSLNWLRHSNRDIADVSQSFSMGRSHTSVGHCVPTVPSTVNMNILLVNNSDS